MKKYLAFFLFAYSSAFALLPPLYESARVIEAILESPFLAPFSGEAIICIDKTKKGYLLETTDSFLFFIVQYSKESSIGPAQFELILEATLSKK